VKTTPSAAASTAATQAFLANRSSTANLSNAAAAAALRSHTTSPVNVGQIQTKRMQRRASVSSNGDAPDRPRLQRRGSSGSLTERTFRDPPPSRQRPSSAQASYTPYQQPPPVPALPHEYASPPQKAARRAASTEPPERVSSPPPRLPGGRGVSLDRGPGVMKSPQGALKPKLNTLDTVGELERPGHRHSVNFSRPMSPQNSPPASPLTGGRVRSPPPTRSTLVAGLPNGEAERILGAIQETATAPVKKKKKVIAKGSTEGSHLTTETVNGPAQGTALQAALQATPQRPAASAASTPSPLNTVSQTNNANDPPKPKKKKKKVIPGAPPTPDPSEGFGSSYPSDTDSVTSERSSTAERPRSYNTRAAGLLMKQPSVIREDRESEEEAEKRVAPKKASGQTVLNGGVGGATPANTSKVVSHKESACQVETPKRASLDVPGSARPHSLSPARAAHFSSKPEYETPGGIRHQPPARSVSPAKSALKYSPSSRGHSPALVAARLAPSEASDTASNMSDDGSRPTKKKSVRVSFDEDSVAVGRAVSPAMSPDSPLVLSPQNKAKGRSWFDLVREKKQEDEGVDSYQDSVIKPTPILPSFGSIRGRPDEPVLDSAKEQKPTEGWAQDTLRSMDTSTDQGVGAIFSQDAAAKGEKVDSQQASLPGANDPLPPQVTSVEGSGYQSDEEAKLSDDRPNDMSNTTPDLSEASTVRISSEEHNSSVPSIALQPATPALESSPQNRSSWLGMPGGFPSSSGPADNAQAPVAPVLEHPMPELTPATSGLAEPDTEAAAHQHDPMSPHVGEFAEGLRHQIDSHSGDESEETGDSVYSDAAEDPDDLDGDGFGSINAIVESPASPRMPLAGKSPPASPSLKAPMAKAPTAQAPQRSPLSMNESELSEPASDEGWERAQAYWSGLSKTRKEQLEHAAQPGALDEPVIPNKTMRGPDPVEKKKKKVPKKSTEPPASNSAPLPPWPDRQYQSDIARPSSPSIAPAKAGLQKSRVGNSQEPQMRSSMRNSQAGNAQESQMRSSMRNGPISKSAMKNSAQNNAVQPPPEPRGALQKKNRPVSAVAMVDYRKPQALPKQGHTRAVSAGGPTNSQTPMMAQPKKKTPAPKPKMLRSDSDSSSSFKKARTSTPNNNKYSMKRTMRPASMDAREPTDGSMSARISSPTGSTGRRPFSSVGPGGSTMRTSMRDSMDSSKPVARTSLRGTSMDSKRTKSPSRFGFGKSKPKPVDSKPNSRFSSRFGDSSDEEDARPAASSRFADSSDDEPAELTPVRGIPRRIDEGDSTDLEDSSVENVPAPSKAKSNGVKAPLDINTKPEGVALATGSLRVPSGDGPAAAMGSGLQAKKAAEKQKRSFFGSLGSKKKADDPTRVRKSDVESAARRDTPLERSRAEMTGTSPTKIDERVLGPSSPMADPVAQSPRPAVGSRTSSAQNSPKSPKLQRRNTPKSGALANNATDISWPLPQIPGGTTSAPDRRPQTSDGAAPSGGGRPDIGRRMQSEEPSPQTAPLVVGKTEKKKRFGILRKAFGLHD